METLLQKICHKGSAWAPRINTDRLFPLSSGSVSSTGYLNDAIEYVEKIQLMDSDLWALFVNQFRQGNVDDHDKGWRGEYWGKMMRGACFCYQCTGDEKLYAVMEATVRDMLSVQGADGRRIQGDNDDIRKRRRLLAKGGESGGRIAFQDAGNKCSGCFPGGADPGRHGYEDRCHLS